MNSDAGDYVEAAADYLNEARTELARTRTVTSDDDVEKLVAKCGELAGDLEAELYQIAVKADAAEKEADEV